MVKKKFIDKKNAVTYNLVFRSTEDGDNAPSRTLAEAGGAELDGAAPAARPAAPAGRYPPGHPLAWLEAERNQEDIPEGRRRELVELGFPDDGYDYLRHVRTLGHGGASLEGLRGPSGVVEGTTGSGAAADASPLGPSVFVPSTAAAPPSQDDVALYDASGLTVLQAAGEGEGEDTGMMGGVTAFSRPQRADAARAADRRELAELEAAMRELDEGGSDEDEDEGGAAAAPEGGAAAAEGWGDLLDDFVVSATDVGPEAHAAAAAAAAAAQQQAGGEEEEEEGPWSSDDSFSGSDDGRAPAPGGSAAAGSRRGGGGPGSIASTYWREERVDRRAMLGVIDERFEALALQYDEEEIGDLEDAGEEGAEGIAGASDVHQFDALLDEFRESQRLAGQPVEAGGAAAPRATSALREQLEAHGFDDDDADVAIRGAKEAIGRFEAQEAAGKGVPFADLEYVDLGPAERWDCETVLSLRSNLYNHPGTITEPGRPRTAPPGVIRLNKAGLPVGVLAPRGGAAGAAAAAAAAAAPPARAAVPAPERKRGETAEEKRARKELVKGAKREARVAKKELKGMFKEEEARAHRRAATAQPQTAVVL
jgi:protein LTV1